MIKQRLFTFIISLFAVISMAAQKYAVTGTILNGSDQSPVELATVRLLTTDSALVTGTFTDSLGMFTLKTDRRGNFLVYVTNIGFKPASKVINISDRGIHVGTLRLESDDKLLGEAVVTETLARVEQKEDTTVFNAGAYRVPDGATLEALIKQFPGIEITEDGKIKWNGKEIKEFLINGKDFFKGETDIAMKNLPVSLVSKVKAYDKKSDYTEQTGIDDGEESTVLDIMTRRELNQSLVSNIDLAGGWDWHDHTLYSGKVFATRFTDKSRITAFASRNNVGDNGFGGPRGMGGGGGGNGITTSTMAGLDFSWENGVPRFKAGRVEVGGNVNYRGRNNETESTNSSETFMTNSTAKSYSNSHSWGTSESHNLSTSFRFQWNPDSLTSLSFRPSYSFSKGNSSSRSRSASFDKDPFAMIPGAESTDDVLDALNWIYERPTYGPLSEAEQQKYQQDYAWVVNLNNRLTFSENQSHNVNGNFNLTRNFRDRQNGNFSVQASGGWSKSESWNYSLSNIYTRQAAGEGSGSYALNPNGTHQYKLSPSINWNYSAGASVSKRLKEGTKWYGELRYNYTHRFQDTDNTLYDLYAATDLPSVLEEYTGVYHARPDGVGTFDVNASLNDLLTMNEADVYAAFRDKENSRYSTYKYDTHRASAGVRYNTQTVQFNASVSFNPEHTNLHYDRPGFLAQPIDTARTVFTVSPQVRFRYNLSKTNRLELFYRGNSSQPNMTQLLPVVDTSNPLNISAGNPGLAPSWGDNVRFSYNGYNADRLAGTQVNLSAQINQRSITTRQVTDELTGVRYSRPENISGNWSTNGGFHYNIGLGKQKLFSLSTGTDLSYSTNVGYSSARGTSSVVEANYPTTFDFMNALFADLGSQKTKSQSTRVNENLSLAYRQTHWDITANGRMNYMHSVSDAQNARNMDTWGFAYGLSGNVTLDCGFSLSTDIRMNSRRGYSEKAMNTNELIWNAQISQSFLKGKALTIQLQLYDILQQQTNISRTVTALSRSDSWNDAINSYFMLHVIYKLNLFNGAHAQNSGDRGGRGGGQGGPGQGGPGYGSGGRPGGQGGGYGGNGGGRPF
ncbi:MAG: outer membrane beta-barrel protein [Bacteroidales bacterium]|nr:outer membrane beta-barrel protein [Bacteroidales bacterium]